jgi:hypothetical protein
MRRPALLVPLLVALAACGASGDAPTDDDATPPPSASDDAGADPVLVIVDGEPSGAGISVEEALGHGPTDDIVVVTGSLFVDADGTVRLCDAMAESFPPQCAGASMEVEGLDLASLDLDEGNGVRWAESVTLLGSVE